MSGLEAVPPAGAAEADFLVVLLVDEPAAGAAGAGAAGAATELPAGVDEVAAGVGVVAAAVDDFLLVFPFDESDELAMGVEAAGCVVSALVDFFVLPLLVTVVLSDPPAGADAEVESVLADFLLPFLEGVLSDDAAVLAEVEL